MRRGKLEKCCTPLRRNRGFGVCVCHTIPTAKVRMPYTVCHLDSRRISGLERVFDVLIISGMILSAGEGDATSLSIGLGLYVSHLQYLLPIRGSLRAPRHSTFLPSRLHPVLVLCHQHAASCTPHACCTRYLLRCSGRGHLEGFRSPLLYATPHDSGNAKDEYDDNSPQPATCTMYLVPAYRASRARLLVLAHATR
jgi:hypothetical protein